MNYKNFLIIIISLLTHSAFSQEITMSEEKARLVARHLTEFKFCKLELEEVQFLANYLEKDVEKTNEIIRLQKEENELYQELLTSKDLQIKSLTNRNKTDRYILYGLVVVGAVLIVK